MIPTVILQARMNSQRLPGKVLTEVNDKPLLQYTIDRLQKSKYIKNIVVATSKERTDKPIAEYCNDHNIMCYRGDLDNVVLRFQGVIKEYGLDSFVRISGDSPLIDSQLVDAGIEMFQENECDIVSNVVERTYPKGQSFEIFKSESFLNHIQNIVEKHDQEHVTPYFYRNENLFKILSYKVSEGNFSQYNLSVDTSEDLDCFKRMMLRTDLPISELRWEALLSVYKEIKNYEFTN